MKNALFPLLAFVLLLLPACSDDEPYYAGYTYTSESTIYNQSSQVQFREVLFSIKPFIRVGEEKMYIVTDTLLNVRVKMNNSLWSVVPSLAIDTSDVPGQVVGPWRVSDYSLKYPVIAAYQPQKTTLTTAGEYSDMLRTYMIIEPGVYFCQVESFEIRMSSGERKKVVPLISEMIEIKENSRSLYLGEFEVEIF